MIFNVPFTEIQQSLYKILNNNIEGYEIYDDTTPIEEIQDKYKSAENIRFVLIRDINANPILDKVTTLIWDVTIQVYCVSNYKGKKYINEMLNDICTVCTSTPLELENYRSLSVKINNVYVNSENINVAHHWHTGVIDLNFKIESNKY